MNEFKSWEDYTELEQLQVEYSELHKDVYGCRARFHYEDTLEELRRSYDVLCDVAEREFAYQQEAQEEAKVKFEKQIAELIDMGAGDRETAIRWITQSYNEYDQAYIDFDPSFMRYELNLPGNYNWKTGEEKAAA